MNNNYLFSSARIGFRNWTEEDLAQMIKISSNKLVMKFFPATATAEQTTVFIHKMRELYASHKYCYFAAIEKQSGKTMGFIGLNNPNYQADFLPNVDIGWRLSPEYWGKGLATEGAKECLAYGFQELQLPKIISTAPIINKASIKVMEKIGMTKRCNFKHPNLEFCKRLVNCVCYETVEQPN